MRQLAYPSLRNLKEGLSSHSVRKNAVADAKRKIFGYACGMPGEEQWVKPLQGRQMMKWYWPSKYMLQDVQMAQYFQMQAMRFAPRPAHVSLTKLSATMEECWQKRDAVRAFFRSVDEKVIRENPTLQDLYGLYRTLCIDDPLQSPIDPAMWRNPGFTWQHTSADNRNALSPTNKKDQSDLSDDTVAARRSEEKATDMRQHPPANVNNDVADLLFSRTEQSHAMRNVCAASPQLHGGKSNRLRDRFHNGAREGETGEEGSLEEPKSLVLDTEARGKAVARRRTQECLLALSALAETGVGQSASEGMQQPAVLRINVGLGDRESVQDTAAFRRKQEQSRRTLEAALDRDEQLARYHSAKHRFFDPLFRRKRLSFLDRFARERIKGEKARQLGAQLYVKHPDQKPVWPDNKGLLTRKWPSPFH
ncbi:conserved hypothetical protein [Neospora caninum Liverpool]|uniref:Uncharacterized protein n=1 Tax=Neospora caninum (strain Liverpool) TaxID=572307 RepID=F0V7U6_NEOCL|nr:conserved hypothetical protein [Neospora caninum Liverpool]CBZ49787.1 conserved hypothetical protein [Neospora caninum Liverpool]CEL64375.1 TPA: hypothetical protein BN1204_002750 [Neospora caninum Liverpool]|eukprot:XP_003879822.1 conserved hypothetical protein [Neospora caninum Liverpool]